MKTLLTGFILLLLAAWMVVGCATTDENSVPAGTYTPNAFWDSPLWNFIPRPSADANNAEFWHK